MPTQSSKLPIQWPDFAHPVVNPPKNGRMLHLHWLKKKLSDTDGFRKKKTHIQIDSRCKLYAYKYLNFDAHLEDKRPILSRFAA